MNNVKSVKFGFSSEEIESRSLTDKVFRMKYDFHRLLRVKKDAERYKRYETKRDM